MRWWIKLSIILVVVILALLVGFTTFGVRPNIGWIGLKAHNKGSAYPEMLISAFLPGPVQDDLKQRGLISIDSVPQDSSASTIDSNGINRLIQSGIYFLNPGNRLELGPISIPGEIQQMQGNAVYRYAQRRTQMWGFLDNFVFTGLEVQVTIPDKVDIMEGGATSHNLYCVHLTLVDGRWVECGVGWVNWTASPIIYTYQSYTGQWSVVNIPGDIQRDINLKIEIGADRMAQMSAFDPQSNKSVRTQQEVGGIGHVVDFAQEQHSKTNQWTDTETARFHDAKIMRMETRDWSNWDNRVATTWIQNPPLYAKRGENGEQNWTETWCDNNTQD